MLDETIFLFFSLFSFLFPIILTIFFTVVVVRSSDAMVPVVEQAVVAITTLEA
jgi:hypothetical protein